MNRKILYIDDKEANLHAFKALLRRDYQVYTATDPNEAIDVIQEEEVALVVADYKMPKMTGVAFLEKVRQEFPGTVRILLSGHADINAVIESVNRGEVFRFIKKPWIEQLLLNELNNAFELYDTKENLALKNEELENAYKELSYFTYSAAHNLTGPVATVQGLTRLLRDEPEMHNEYLGYIDDTLHAMNTHLRNIISFNKNKIDQVLWEEVDLKKFFATMMADFKFYPGFSEMDVNVSVSQDGTFISDNTRLNLICSNLIINAIKYQDENKEKRWLNVDCHCKDGVTKINIEDNGIGIAPENLKRVTQIFFREASDRLGSGIGLFIVGQTLHKLNGSFQIESEKGESTRISVTLPSGVVE